MFQAYEALKQDVSQFIHQPNAGAEEFNKQAIAVFQFQYEHNQTFRKFCRKRRVSPRTVKHFTDIPPVPIDAFKFTTLSSHSIEEAEAVFMTSGTTNPEKRGKNYHRDLEIYDLSMKTFFKPTIIPDVEQIKMLVLFPEEEAMPNSSLAHYLHIAKETFGTEDSLYMFSEHDFQVEKLITELKQAEKRDEPILLIGATFSFIHLLDECHTRGIHFTLPPKSRVMDTGGAKGRSREMDPGELKKELSRLFTLPLELCLNMYGMTELSSQMYDGNLVLDKCDFIDPVKISPHWVTTMVVDIDTMQEKPEGEKGVIVHYDLANVNSVMAILTEDIGVKSGNGFRLLGRAEGAEAKGCSLAVEQFLATSKSSRGEIL
ncbi:long-chain fatty acid--CoA ligase [Alkalihalobacillus sp. MEB130]|uniref:LuxE/PaaK family acyltransferase n=1 Tax=Alkalihalobacillus sp. MEB130 TaxID=2976704 RepID=UPI0028DDFDAB|nr:long-chain fatty acid--CoA ligase [Alkalihalobacillus sp. MEB130]MDT8862902.1 long-chain fatty acid--CoA ligase [Alkalihalobacillus sp. MEB130]